MGTARAGMMRRLGLFARRLSVLQYAVDVLKDGLLNDLGFEADSGVAVEGDYETAVARLA